MSLFLAVLWTIVLAGNVIACAMGKDPNWYSVFGPLIVVTLDYWDKYRNNRF